jgi:5-methylcytosine-specific restriction endonuclease McrA
MEKLRQKQPRLILDAEKYDRLKIQILKRDGWKCQHCGSSTNLQVHHLVFRSRLGPDASNNLITLCVNCHRRAHDPA